MIYQSKAIDDTTTVVKRTEPVTMDGLALSAATGAAVGSVTGAAIGATVGSATGAIDGAKE